jgi:hypothetical protein
MPMLPETPLRDRMRVQFAEADFEIAFSLVDMAEGEAICCNYARASRILEDADRVFLDIQQTLRKLTVSDRGPFGPLLRELDRAIVLAKLNVASGQ